MVRNTIFSLAGWWDHSYQKLSCLRLSSCFSSVVILSWPRPSSSLQFINRSFRYASLTCGISSLYSYV